MDTDSQDGNGGCGGFDWGLMQYGDFGGPAITGAQNGHFSCRAHSESARGFFLVGDGAFHFDY